MENNLAVLAFSLACVLWLFGLYTWQQKAQQQFLAQAAQEIALQEKIDAAEYIGNKYTKKFHLLDCSYLPLSENRIYFEFRAQAIEYGMFPWQHCNP